MQIDTFSETRKAAIAKWREYKAAEKVSSNPLYKDLRKIYNQVKSGRKIIDIFKVIQKGGVKTPGYPNFAIAKASAKKVTCLYFTDGRVSYEDDKTNWRNRFEFKDCLPTFTFTNPQPWQNDMRLQAPVPLIPPKYLPAKLTDDYYILWEVDEWKMVPSTDPWLLRRITKNHFVVLAGWDLTELEKSVMAGRME